MFKESTFVLNVTFNILLKVKLSIKSKNNRNVYFFSRNLRDLSLLEKPERYPFTEKSNFRM